MKYSFPRDEVLSADRHGLFLNFGVVSVNGIRLFAYKQQAQVV
jgi:hypothetical protein